MTYQSRTNRTRDTWPFLTFDITTNTTPGLGAVSVERPVVIDKTGGQGFRVKRRPNTPTMGTCSDRGDVVQIVPETCLTLPEYDWLSLVRSCVGGGCGVEGGDQARSHRSESLMPRNA